jgi:hypothetical protein
MFHNPKENLMIKHSLFMLAALVALGAQAQTTVAEPWVRGTVPQQKATGMFARSRRPRAASWSRPAHPWPAWWRSTRWRWKATP